MSKITYEREESSDTEDEKKIEAEMQVDTNIASKKSINHQAIATIVPVQNISSFYHIL